MGLESIKQPKTTLDSLKEFCAKPEGFLLVSGNNGTGKSFAALQLYHTQTRYRLPDHDDTEAIFITQADLNMRWLSNQEHLKFLLNQVCQTKFLVLDDIGTRTPSDAFIDFLYAIVDHRYTYRHKQATIITTNLNASDMREKFGDAFVSRVASGRCFRFEGGDRRFNSSLYA